MICDSRLYISRQLEDCANQYLARSQNMQGRKLHLVSLPPLDYGEVNTESTSEDNHVPGPVAKKTSAKDSVIREIGWASPGNLKVSSISRKPTPTDFYKQPGEPDEMLN